MFSPSVALFSRFILHCPSSPSVLASSQVFSQFGKCASNFQGACSKAWLFVSCDDVGMFFKGFFFLLCSGWVTLIQTWKYKMCHNTSVIAPNVDHSFASASLKYLKHFLSINTWSSCLSFPFGERKKGLFILYIFDTWCWARRSFEPSTTASSILLAWLTHWVCMALRWGAPLRFQVLTRRWMTMTMTHSWKVIQLMSKNLALCTLVGGSWSQEKSATHLNPAVKSGCVLQVLLVDSTCCTRVRGERQAVASHKHVLCRILE